MKIIFLDVDGVLNTPSSRSRCGGHAGIDRDKLLRLKTIVDKTNARIVLISTWKAGWEREQKHKFKQDIYARYLDEKFKHTGLAVYDKTPDRAEGIYLSRGEGILEFMDCKTIESFVILDDYQFDYDGCGLTDNFERINHNVGLTDGDAVFIIEKLQTNSRV